jgi:hypothetical protein
VDAMRENQAKFFTLNNEDHMSKIVIKHFRLFEYSEQTTKGIIFYHTDINEPNKEIEKFLALKTDDLDLRMDLQITIPDAIIKARQNFGRLHEGLLKDYKIEKEVEFENGEKQKNAVNYEPMPELEYVELKEEERGKVVHKINGEVVGPLKPVVIDEKIQIEIKPEFHLKFSELLEQDITLECYPIKFSKLKTIPDFGTINIVAIKEFIFDDRES